MEEKGQLKAARRLEKEWDESITSKQEYHMHTTILDCLLNQTLELRHAEMIASQVPTRPHHLSTHMSTHSTHSSSGMPR